MIFLVGIGGMIGACSRFGLGLLINRNTKTLSLFPVATFLINALGSFILGLLASAYLAGTIGEPLFLLFGAGFCGAFTTFSTFGTETMGLVEKKHYGTAALYVVSSLLIGICFAGIGFII